MRGFCLTISLLKATIYVLNLHALSDIFYTCLTTYPFFFFYLRQFHTHEKIVICEMLGQMITEFPFFSNVLKMSYFEAKSCWYADLDFSSHSTEHMYILLTSTFNSYHVSCYGPRYTWINSVNNFNCQSPSKTLNIQNRHIRPGDFL